MLERISFVCQTGELEPQATLLAASLRLHFPSSVKLLAAHPNRHGELAQSTLTALECLGVEIAPITNPLDDAYLIGHKVAAVRLLHGQGLGMFLDSDILAMREPDKLTGKLAAVPASRQHCPLLIWRHIYESFGLSFPGRGPPTLVSQEMTAPYYNSGVIALPGEMAAHLADVWTQCAWQIDSDQRVPHGAKRPFLDQTSFPIAAAMVGQSVETLGAHWNFPSWDWLIADGSCPIFFHYQKLQRLTREPATFEAACAARSILPAVEEAVRLGGATDHA
jgi:hypothetical protein